MSDALRQAEIAALLFLEKGEHQMDPLINDESEMAAAMMFLSLIQDGRALCTVGDAVSRGPSYTITPKGRQWLLDARSPDSEAQNG